jgi:hypothetical protein
MRPQAPSTRFGRWRPRSRRETVEGLLAGDLGPVALCVAEAVRDEETEA